MLNERHVTEAFTADISNQTPANIDSIDIVLYTVFLSFSKAGVCKIENRVERFFL